MNFMFAKEYVEKCDVTKQQANSSNTSTMNFLYPLFLRYIVSSQKQNRSYFSDNHACVYSNTF